MEQKSEDLRPGSAEVGSVRPSPPITGPGVSLSTATALSVHVASAGVLARNASWRGER